MASWLVRSPLGRAVWVRALAGDIALILVPIALFSSLSRRSLGTRIESIFVPRPRRLRDEKRAMGTRMHCAVFLGKTFYSHSASL